MSSIEQRAKEILEQLTVWNTENEGYNDILYKFWNGHENITERLCYVNELISLVRNERKDQVIAELVKVARDVYANMDGCSISEMGRFRKAIERAEKELKEQV